MKASWFCFIFFGFFLSLKPTPCQDQGETIFQLSLLWKRVIEPQNMIETIKGFRSFRTPVPPTVTRTPTKTQTQVPPTTTRTPRPTPTGPPPTPTVTNTGVVPPTLTHSRTPSPTPDPGVDIPDDSLELVIRAELNKPTGAITETDMLQITFLIVSQRGISSLKGLEFAKNLEFLSAWGNMISSLAPLSGLTNLTSLNIDDNQIASLSPISGLTQLESLNAAENMISDIGAIAEFSNLQTLALGGNEISDIRVIQNFTQLDFLSVRQNNITDLSPIVENFGIGNGDFVSVFGNPLSEEAINTQIPALEARGVDVLSK